MSNGLTGDFEAALEVRIEALNRILATVHQKGAEDASPKFLHSLTARVGDVPKHPKFELAEAFVLQNFGEAIEDVSTLPDDLLQGVQKDLLGIRRTLLTTAKSIGAIDASAGLALVQSQFPGLFVVRGTAKVQISNLIVTFPEGTTSEATIHCQIRAHYTPDPGTAALPAPIHGQVQVGFVVKHHPAGSSGQPMLEVEVTGDDSKIVFVPAVETSLTAAETKIVAREVRRFARTAFEPMTVDLPPKQHFPFHRFKTLGSGSTQAVALPFNLTPTVKVPALADFPDLFLASGDDFAVALSGKYIESLLKGPLDTLKSFAKTYIVTIGFPVPVPPFWLEKTFVFHVSVADVKLLWEIGKVVLLVEGHYSTDPDEPSTVFTITQGLKLQLSQTTPTMVTVTKVGGLQQSGLPEEVWDKARPVAEDLRDAALNAAAGQIESLADSLRVDDSFKPFDAQAKSTFSSVEMAPGGVVLHGMITASQRLPVKVVPVDVALDGDALSALKSWIPGGSIGKFVWSWVSHDPSKPYVPWDGTEHQKTEVHRFLFQPHLGAARLGSQTSRRQVPPWETYQMCLRVEGTQIPSSAGPPTSVSGGTLCQIQQPGWVAIVPSWWDAVLLAPVWGPDPGPEAILEEAIVAHINVRSRSVPAPDARTTSLIHFESADPGKSLSLLSEALLHSRHREARVPVVVVLPRGSFAHTRSVVEVKLGSFAQELRAPLLVTEDYEGSWTRAFDATAGDATYLLSGEGQLVWSFHGRLDAGSLTAVLDQHVRAGPWRRLRTLRLSVRAGEPAPDVLLEDGRGGGVAMRQLRGRRVVLMFWKACSKPCLSELRRLQHVHDRAGRHVPVIFAVGDGEPSERVADVARELQLGFPLVADSDRRIARSYGVNCWPTLVSINEDGVIDVIHSGVTPGPSRHLQ